MNYEVHPYIAGSMGAAPNLTRKFTIARSKITTTNLIGSVIGTHQITNATSCNAADSNLIGFGTVIVQTGGAADTYPNLRNVQAFMRAVEREKGTLQSSPASFPTYGQSSDEQKPSMAPIAAPTKKQIPLSNKPPKGLVPHFFEAHAPLIPNEALQALGRFSGYPAPAFRWVVKEGDYVKDQQIIAKCLYPAKENAALGKANPFKKYPSFKPDITARRAGVITHLDQNAFYGSQAAGTLYSIVPYDYEGSVDYYRDAAKFDSFMNQPWDMTIYHSSIPERISDYLLAVRGSLALLSRDWREELDRISRQLADAQFSITPLPQDRRQKLPIHPATVPAP